MSSLLNEIKEKPYVRSIEQDMGASMVDVPLVTILIDGRSAPYQDLDELIATLDNYASSYNWKVQVEWRRKSNR